MSSKSSLIQKGHQQRQHITYRGNETTKDYIDTHPTMDRTAFKERLIKARQSKVTDKEVDFLF